MDLSLEMQKLASISESENSGDLYLRFSLRPTKKTFFQQDRDKSFDLKYTKLQLKSCNLVFRNWPISARKLNSSRLKWFGNGRNFHFQTIFSRPEIGQKWAEIELKNEQNLTQITLPTDKKKLFFGKGVTSQMTEISLNYN